LDRKCGNERKNILNVKKVFRVFERLLFSLETKYLPISSLPKPLMIILHDRTTTTTTTKIQNANNWWNIKIPFNVETFVCLRPNLHLNAATQNLQRIKLVTL